MTTATAVLPGPFTLAFSNDDNHCSIGVDAAVDTAEDDLDGADAKQLRAMADDSAAQRLRELANEAADAGELDRFDTLQFAAESLEVHPNGCDCAQDSWMLTEEVFNDALAAFGTRLWAVTVNGEPATDWTMNRKQVSVFGLWSINGDRHGWAEVRLEWTGAWLAARFTGQYGETGEIRLHPLAAEQEVWYELWCDGDPHDPCVAAKLYATDTRVLATAARIVRAIGALQYDLEFHNWVQALVAGKVYELDETTIEVIAGLAPAWEHSAAELLTTAMLLTAAPAAA
jgi:hypothetical protein